MYSPLDLLNYCREHIEDFAVLEKLALKNIDKMRCPLSMACPELHAEMEGAIEDFCDENEIDIDYFDEIDTDAIFWATE